MRLSQTIVQLLLVSCVIRSTQANGSLRDQIVDRPELSQFRAALSAVGLLEGELDDPQTTLTIFAPNNAAIAQSRFFQKYMEGMNESPPRWHWNLNATLNNHIVEGSPALTEDVVFNSETTTLQSREDELTVSQFLSRIEGAPIVEGDIQATNGILHILGGVMEPVFFENSFSNLELQPEFGPDWLDRVSLVDIVDFVGFRDDLDTFRDGGTTMIGCRIRALNRIGLDYLPQTINDSNDVKYGEFLNETRKEETRQELYYNLLPKAYYADNYPEGYLELTYPMNDCAHMWITKHQEILVFNDARTVQTPDSRIFVSNNGPGYVVDRCLVCPGISMLTKYAGLWTIYNMKDTAQFFTASEWNMRDLRRSVGSGGDLTLFAPVFGAWEVLNLEDVTRLASDKWKPHQWDLLGHMLVEQLLLEQDLKDLWHQNGGAYNLTSTIGQIIPMDYDQQRDVVRVSDGDIFYADIKGVDGRVHFVTEATLPISMTHTVYDIANVRDHLTTHVTLIDAVRLKQDMERLLPLTAMYVPNDMWANIKIDLQDIAPVVLESHMIEDLWWCDRLRDNVGERVESLNGETWFISINDDDMPCFDTATAFGGPVIRSCITECDILARNGIVHVMDSLMLYETPETLGPSPPTPPIARAPTPPGLSPTFSRGNSDNGGFPTAGGSGGGSSPGVPGSESSNAGRSFGGVITALVLSVVLAMSL